MPAHPPAAWIKAASAAVAQLRAQWAATWCCVTWALCMLNGPGPLLHGFEQDWESHVLVGWARSVQSLSLTALCHCWLCPQPGHSRAGCFHMHGAGAAGMRWPPFKPLNKVRGRTQPGPAWHGPLAHLCAGPGRVAPVHRHTSCAAWAGSGWVRLPGRVFHEAQAAMQSQCCTYDGL